MRFKECFVRFSRNKIFNMRLQTRIRVKLDFDANKNIVKMYSGLGDEALNSLFPSLPYP